MMRATRIKTSAGAGLVSRVEALSMSCATFLPCVWMKRRGGTAVEHPYKSLYTKHVSPQPASPFVMLVESDLSAGSHQLLP
jgi:hypothetical protein